MIRILVRIPGLISVIEKILVVLTSRIFNYRKTVIEGNLHRCFPELTPQELKSMQQAYYKNMIRYMRETIQIGFGSEKSVFNHVRKNTSINESVNPDGSSSYIMMGSHYGNWETVSLLPVLYPNQTFIAFYKPVENSLSAQLFHYIRSRFGLQLYPITQTARIIKEYKHKPVCYIFVGDQSPLNMNGVHWNIFLGQHTPWLTGGERLARKYNLQVVYWSIKPEAFNESGPSYEISIQNICDTPLDMQTGKITEIYSRLLEQQIIEKPEYWLWSHKRWKRADLRR